MASARGLLTLALLAARSCCSKLVPKCWVKLAEFGYGVQNTPTVRNLCAAVKLLDESEFSVLIPSGLSALAKSGDRVLIVDMAHEPLKEFCC